MNLLDEVRYLWPTWHVLALELLLVFAGGCLLSYLLNGQEEQTKRLNVGKATGILYAAASLDTIRALLTDDAPRLWPYLGATLVLIGATVGDMVAYTLWHRHHAPLDLAPKEPPPQRLRPSINPLPVVGGLVLAVLVLVACNQMQQNQSGTTIDSVFEVNAQSLDACPTLPVYDCVLVTVVPPTDAAPTVTPAAVSPTPTPRPTTAAPTPTPIAPPATVVPTAPNLLRNPGLEPPYTERGPRKIVAWGWELFECNGCPAPRWGMGNDYGLMMGTAEFKPASFGGTAGREWMQGTSAQQWFCFYYSCRAGVYQTVTTIPSATCEVGARVRSWSNYDSDIESELDSDDDRINSQWVIRIDREGGVNAKDVGLLVSRVFGYDDGIYDAWAAITYTFTATGPKTTVFFENLRTWPIPNNDNYLDAAYVRCTQ